MSKGSGEFSGGCMCGAVRFHIRGTPFDVAYCHCQSCRKHTGGPVATLAGFKVGEVSFTGAGRKLYGSSPGVHRAFCGDCGTSLTWEGEVHDKGPIMEFHISTFDDPEVLVPTSHANEPERIGWFDVADELPRYEGLNGVTTLLHHGPLK